MVGGGVAAVDDVLLLKVSGVTLLEKTSANAARRIAHYIARTNAFFPWRPRP